MNLRNSSNRTSKLAAAGYFTAAFIMLFAAGCDPIDATYVAPGNGGPYTDPAALITAYEMAWEDRDYADYAALLDDEFEFYPLQEDADDIPWMTGNSWNRDDELGMVGHMFDPTYSDGNGALDLIEFDATPQSTRPIGDDLTEVICTAFGRVMWTPTDGATFDTRVIFELVELDGHLLIREMREIPRTTSRESISVEAASLGSIKNLYR